MYGNTESNIDRTLPLPFRNYPAMGEVIPHSCDSLSTVTITNLDMGSLADSFHTWHIVVSLFNSSIDWVHVGEVRFLGTDVFNPGIIRMLIGALVIILSLFSCMSMLVFCVFTKQ